MRKEPVAGAEVEVCDRCEGLWIDWFDGELHTLAAEAEAARVDRGTPPPRHAGEPNVPEGSRACPRCMRELTSELYRFRDAHDDELVSGVELLRCSDCAGSFVPRPSAHLLLDRLRQPRAATLSEAFVAFVRRLVRRPARSD